jgi:hypothetical protein
MRQSISLIDRGLALRAAYARPSSVAVAVAIPVAIAVAAALAAEPSAAEPARSPLQTDTVPKELVDPLDGHRFDWPVLLSTNGLGGFDADGCTYARGVQPRALAVATSPTTLYTQPVDRWDRAIPDEQKKRLLQMLLLRGEQVEDGRRLSAAERWEIAATVSAQLGDGPATVGEQYLQAAWSVRDGVVGFLAAVQGATDAWKKLAELSAAARTLKDGKERTVAMFDLARLAQRGGFPIERDGFLRALDEFPDAGLGASAKREEFTKRVAEEERLLKLARARFEEAVRGGAGTPAERAGLRFLVAEISRRIGDFQQAETWLAAVVEDRAADEETRSSVTDVKNVLAVQGRAR